MPNAYANHVVFDLQGFRRGKKVFGGHASIGRHEKVKSGSSSWKFRPAAGLFLEARRRYEADWCIGSYDLVIMVPLIGSTPFIWFGLD